MEHKWAYISVPHSGGQNEKKIVQLTEISNFDVKKMKTKMFNVHLENNEFKQCHVLAIGNKEQLEKEVKRKRAIIPPKKMVDSASEMSEKENVSTKKKKMTKDDEAKRIENSLQSRINALNEKNKVTQSSQRQGERSHKYEDRKKDEETTLLKKKIAEIEKQLEEAKLKIKMLEEEIEKQFEDSKLKIKMLEEEKNEIEQLLIEKETVLQQVDSLNKTWQSTALTNWERLAGVFEKIDNISQPSILNNNASTQVGQLSEDGKEIHIGNDIWLSMELFSFATSNAKSVSVLTRNLAVIIFGESTLKNSTVTGKSSNRTRNSEKSIQRLDPTKMVALKEFIRWFLVKYWRKTPEEADEEVDMVRHYISRKIAHLKDCKSYSRSEKNEAEGDEHTELEMVNPFVNNVTVIETEVKNVQKYDSS